MKKSIFILTFLVTVQVAAQAPGIVFKNNQGVGLLKTEDKVFEGAELLQKEVVNHPESPELRYNLGSAMELSKENDKAIQEYLSAAKLAGANKDGLLQFQAFFNAARAYGEKKEIPNALKYYQMALEIQPDSQEVKTNIELLLANSGGGSGGDSDKQDGKQDKKQDGKDQDKKDGKDKEPKQDSPQNQQPKGKPKPKPFKSEELTEQDVKRILDELKRQEEQIRAKMMNKKSRSQDVEKDW